MLIELQIKNGNQNIYDMFLAFLKTQPKIEFDIKKDGKTINGFTQEFEEELLSDLEETKRAYKKGELKTFDSVNEFRKAVDCGKI